MKTSMKLKTIGICALLLVNLSGCKLGNAKVVVSSGFTDSEVFKIRDEVCTLPQARVILTNYQNMYSTMYDIDLWEHDFEGPIVFNFMLVFICNLAYLICILIY